MTATMKRRVKWPWTGGGALVAAASMTVAVATAHRTSADQTEQDRLIFSDPTGVQRTVATDRVIDLNNPFFQDLGTNGRTCFTCHRPAQAWTITPEELRERFERTQGLDPVFRANDGSDCEGADVSALGSRRSAFSMLLSKGLIRIGLKVPDRAEFEIVDVDDPHGCGAPLTEASVYRRPWPSTNVAFLSAVMWDGRETVRVRRSPALSPLRHWTPRRGTRKGRSERRQHDLSRHSEKPVACVRTSVITRSPWL